MTGPDPLSDAALAARYRDGDEQAAAELVARHAGPISRFLYASGARESDLDDLLQEAFFRAFRKLDTWRGDSSFRSWMFSIASNLLRDQYRRRRGRVVLPLEERDLPDPGDPHTELAAQEAEERIRSGLAGLPRLQREVFLMRVQEGAEYEDIAAALGTTPGAARVHYHHAVKRLKERVS